MEDVLPHEIIFNMCHFLKSYRVCISVFLLLYFTAALLDFFMVHYSHKCFIRRTIFNRHQECTMCHLLVMISSDAQPCQSYPKISL